MGVHNPVKPDRFGKPLNHWVTMMVGAVVAGWIGAGGCADDSSSGSQTEADISPPADMGGNFTWPDVGGGVPDVGSLDGGGDVVVGCSSDEQCATDNPCVIAVCGAKGQCVTTPLVGKTCDDTNACTQEDQCGESGQCDGGIAVVVPNEVCADCSCDPDRGVVCIPKAPGAGCDDGDCCTNNDVCVACVAGEPGCSAAG